MVREDQIVAAAVDVNLLAEDVQVHGRALDVPARATLSPGAIPGRFVGLGGLPQGEVHRVLFLLADLDARASLHIVQPAAGEFAVFFVFGDAEVDIPGRGVGVALFDQTLDHGLDLVHRLGGARVGCRRQDIQVGEMPPEVLNVAFGQLEGVRAHQVGSVDDLIVHVGVVHNVPDLVAAILEVAADNVEDQGRHGMPDVRVAIDRRAADIHFHYAGFEGLEFFFLAGEGVIDAQHRMLLDRVGLL